MAKLPVLFVVVVAVAVGRVFVTGLAAGFCVCLARGVSTVSTCDETDIIREEAVDTDTILCCSSTDRCATNAAAGMAAARRQIMMRLAVVTRWRGENS